MSIFLFMSFLAVVRLICRTFKCQGNKGKRGKWDYEGNFTYFTHYFLTNPLWVVGNYYPHFTEEKTEAQKVYVTCPSNGSMQIYYVFFFKMLLLYLNSLTHLEFILLWSMTQKSFICIVVFSYTNIDQWVTLLSAPSCPCPYSWMGSSLALSVQHCNISVHALLMIFQCSDIYWALAIKYCSEDALNYKK